MAGMKTRIEHINAEIEELNTLTKQRKREVDQAKIMIGNYKEQQNNVRNNREFDAITKEIEYQELEIELAEKRLKEYSAGVKAKKLQLEAEAVAVGRAADLAARRTNWKDRGRDRTGSKGRPGQDRRAPVVGLWPHPQQCAQRAGRDRQAMPAAAASNGSIAPGASARRRSIICWRTYPTGSRNVQQRTLPRWQVRPGFGPTPAFAAGAAFQDQPGGRCSNHRRRQRRPMRTSARARRSLRRRCAARLRLASRITRLLADGEDFARRPGTPHLRTMM